MVYEVVDFQDAHLEHLLADLREIDRKEWLYGAGMTIEQQLAERHTEEGTRVKAILIDGKCEVVFGVTPIGWLGQVFLAATNKGQRHGRALHRRFKSELALIERDFPTLIAFTFDLNVAHHKWLVALGFTYETRRVLGPEAALFKVYRKEVTECVA